MFISGLLDVTLTLTNIVTEGMRGIDNDNGNGGMGMQCADGDSDNYFWWDISTHILTFT